MAQLGSVKKATSSDHQFKLDQPAIVLAVLTILLAVSACSQLQTTESSTTYFSNSMDNPRISPVPLEKYLADNPDSSPQFASLHFTRTLANSPKLASAAIPFALHILGNSSLPPKDRELLILRIGWLCQAEYEWRHHKNVGLRVGLSLSDVMQTTRPPAGTGWNQTLIRAADELHRNAKISDKSWEALSEKYSDIQLLDLIFTVGQYNMVSMFLNSTGVQLEPDFKETIASE
jgi:4-carboxymuconolactone decarboxylase